MGEPVKITKLAEQLIHLSGLTIKNKVKKQGDIEQICFKTRENFMRNFYKI